jgi:DNA polymerase III alpha subunit
MAFLAVEDLTSKAELIVFPSTFAKVELLLKQFDVFIIKGFVDIASQNTCKIKVSELIPVDLALDDPAAAKTIRLTLPTVIDGDAVQNIKQTLMPGSTPVQFSFYENNQQLTLMSSFKATARLDSFKALQSQGISTKITI